MNLDLRNLYINRVRVKSKIIYLAQSNVTHIFYIFRHNLLYIYVVVPRVGQVGREASVFVGEPGDDGGGCSLLA